MIEGAKPLETEQWFQSLTISEHVEHYISEQNIKSKKAIKLVAEDRHMKTEKFMTYIMMSINDVAMKR